MERQALLLWVECFSIFVVIPVLFAYKLIPTPSIVLPLLIVCVPVFLWLGKTCGYKVSVFWQGDSDKERSYITIVVKRVLLTSSLIIGLAVVTIPQQLFDFPKAYPELWLLFLAIYFVISVYPQELLYRAFIFRRYKPIIESEKTLAVVSAILFGWMHVAFGNWTAVLLSSGGGWLIATTYRQTRSLRMACLEHALYGLLIFSIGYGRSFIFEPYMLNMLENAK
jgi:membrane protease YdiL (CAAX protease family)